MKGRTEFDQRVGRETTPLAREMPRAPGEAIEESLAELRRRTPFEGIDVIQLYRFCSVSPPQGCYALTFTPRSRYPVALVTTVFRGTLRFEEVGTEIVVSADLYRFKTTFPFEFYKVPRKYKSKWGFETAVTANIEDFRIRPELFEAGKLDRFRPRRRIPIYARQKYYSYLQGVSARLNSVVFVNDPCQFSLTFDEFVYQHPATGFDGTFPATADRRVRMVLSESGSSGSYDGKLYEGTRELGSISLRWLSPYYRRADLEVNRLDGAVIPQPVPHPSGTGTEDFSTIFASAGWDLRVTRDNTAVALPGSLSGVQDPADCWSRENSHDLMDSLPNYDPSELDSRWKAHLVAVPADLGCSRGRMFDNSSGDVNDIAREGSVTHSDDGYPSGDTAEYGSAEDELQRDVPRAYLRSAAHEVGHTFNQIHQNFEGGNDNSIMTVTPAVSIVLDDAGEDFPDDIDLAFNATVRRHLIHLPDPAVRPGAMGFFGSAVNAPEADVNFFDAEDLDVKIKLKNRARLGEPLWLRWSVKNRSKDSIPVPDRVDADSEVARISVTNPGGSIRYMKSFTALSCTRNRVCAMKPGDKREASAPLFWSKNGFAFDAPGRYQVEVILLWEIEGLVVGARGAAHVWVDHPVCEEDNEVAALMFDEEVGKAVARGEESRHSAAGLKRASRILDEHPEHPACESLRKLLDRSRKERER